MNAKDRINALIKEAGVYRSQGLLKEAKSKYHEIIKWVENSKNADKADSFIRSVRRKIDEIDQEIKEIDAASETPELTADVQDLISNLFSYSADKDEAAIEGAVALAEFGQYEKALAEFQKLLDAGVLPMTVAKNMIRCHLMMGSSRDAVSQINQWKSSGAFSKAEMINLKDFYLETARSRKKKKDAPKPGAFPLPPQDAVSAAGGQMPPPVEEPSPRDQMPPPAEKPSPRDQIPPSVEEPSTENEMQDVLEISAFKIDMNWGSEKERAVEFEVTFQVGAVVSFIVKADESTLLEVLRPGARLSGIQCISPVAIFDANGVISEMKKIEFGPRAGNYSLRLRLTTS